MIKLPKIDIQNNNLDLLYGINKVLKEYCNLKLTPIRLAGSWVHGSSFPWFRNHVETLILGNSMNLNKMNYVGTKLDEIFLKKKGYKALAIGLPICYVKEKKYKRIKNSILFFPSHSTHYMASSNNNEHNLIYRDYIKKIIDDFQHYYVSVHGDCLKRGMWINELKEINVEIIPGSNTHDLNSLDRTYALMNQFEFVTTNSIGSHIAYAAAFGAKVSISGSMHKYSRLEYLKDPFFLKNQHLIDVYLSMHEEARKLYPFLFVDDPRKAKKHIDWGLEMIGMENKMSPEDLKKELKIDFFNTFLIQNIDLLKKIARKILK